MNYSPAGLWRLLINHCFQQRGRNIPDFHRGKSKTGRRAQMYEQTNRWTGNKLSQSVMLQEAALGGEQCPAVHCTTARTYGINSVMVFHFCHFHAATHLIKYWTVEKVRLPPAKGDNFTVRRNLIHWTFVKGLSKQKHHYWTVRQSPGHFPPG